MAPERRTGIRNVLRAAAPPQLAQYTPHELTRVGYQSGRLADLGHGRGNKVGLHTLDVDAVGL